MNAEDKKNVSSIEQSKEIIAQAIKNEMKQRGISYRRLAEKTGSKHQMITRITSNKNYTIETLLTTLDGLDMEIHLKRKGS